LFQISQPIKLRIQCLFHQRHYILVLLLLLFGF
jgi:hypothetical protein